MENIPRRNPEEIEARIRLTAEYKECMRQNKPKGEVDREQGEERNSPDLILG